MYEASIRHARNNESVTIAVTLSFLIRVNSIMSD